MKLLNAIVRIAFILKLSGPLHADDDLQVWVATTASQRLEYSLEAMVEWENRLSDNPVWMETQVMPQLIWHYSPRYDFGIGYEHDHAWDELENEVTANEGLVFATIKWVLGDWSVSSRQRFQAGVMDGPSGSRGTAVFRQLSRLDYLGSYNVLQMRPYLSDEWLVNLADGYISENRLQFGVTYPLNDHSRLEAYFMRLDRWDENGSNNFTPVMGIHLLFNF